MSSHHYWVVGAMYVGRTISSTRSSASPISGSSIQQGDHGLPRFNFDLERNRPDFVV